MKLCRNGIAIDVPTNRRIYLFFNEHLFVSADNSDAIQKAESYILNTLVVLNLHYDKETNMWDGDDGYAHEVIKITTIKSTKL